MFLVCNMFVFHLYSHGHNTTLRKPNLTQQISYSPILHLPKYTYDITLLMIVSNYNCVFIHEEIRDTHIHILDVTTIYLPDVIEYYMHTPSAIHINILNSDIINNYIHISDIMNNYMHILGAIPINIHNSDIINNYIHIPDIINIHSSILQ